MLCLTVVSVCGWNWRLLSYATTAFRKTAAQADVCTRGVTEVFTNFPGLQGAERGEI